MKVNFIAICLFLLTVPALAQESEQDPYRVKAKDLGVVEQRGSMKNQLLEVKDCETAYYYLRAHIGRLESPGAVNALPPVAVLSVASWISRSAYKLPEELFIASRICVKEGSCNIAQLNLMKDRLETRGISIPSKELAKVIYENSQDLALCLKGRNRKGIPILRKFSELEDALVDLINSAESTR